MLVKEALAAGNTAPKYHSLTRPPETEGEATNRAIQLGAHRRLPVYIVHVSCEDAIEPIERAREKGWDVVGETCPSTCASTSRRSTSPASRARSTSTRRLRARRPPVEACWDAIVSGQALGRLDRPRALQLQGPEGHAAQTTSRRSRTGRPESRSGSRCLHRVRRPGRQIRPEPDGPAVRDRPGEAVRPLSAQGHDRGRQRRRSRHLRSRKKRDDLGRHAPLDVRLQPVRGHRGDGVPGDGLVRGQLVVDDGELVAKPGTGKFIKRARVGEKLLPTAGG